ncbi:ATP-dependent RNA helicase DeaD [Catalinimonas alkaloidigena]|uniref:DEAD/DEAH box helicase n=1 Tax=Catalinimonas alkaloidigena TaxID=1075417 RepID=UPI002404F603|nr:DEAD/DEAH box helicase [Catalinimonas alkaloidigena]MDF9798638.1 ATP-dependent RNA helicase DeaD [Catalinimonas alkaloidigena]
MTRFDALGLREEILQSLSELKFEEPTPIQEQAIPFVLNSENDLIAFAQTGTGKTAAFGLPIIQQVDEHNDVTQALILSPTRELCLQISNDLATFSKYLKTLNVVPVYGGADIAKQMKQLKDGAQIVVGTPGRVLDLIKRKKLKVENISHLVLDEADEMLSMGFKDELDAILGNTPQDKQTLLFSATMPKEMMAIAEKYMHQPEEISVGKRNAGADNVQHQFIPVHAKDRYEVLKRIVDINPNMYGIVFCRTRNDTREIADHLMKDGYNADALHGDLSQAQRDVVMNRFRRKNLQLLIATDVAARGLDVNDLTHVINHSLPDDPEVYVHRSGRTGRAGRSGICLTLVHGRDKGKLKQIERTVNKKFEQKPVPSGRDICEKQLFTLIDKVEKVDVNPEIEQFLPAIISKLSWLDKDDLIKHFVSMEFNQMLEHYKNSPDLNASFSADKGKKDRKEKRDRKPKKGAQTNGSTFSRFFMNMGKKDKMSPKVIIGMVNKHMPDEDVKIGQIEILNNFSFFEVDRSYEKDVLDALQYATHKGKGIGVEIAKDKA